MARINITSAKIRLSELIQRAALGKDIVITKENKPVAKIVPVKPIKRKPGTGKGIWMAPDFDEPLDLIGK